MDESIFKKPLSYKNDFEIIKKLGAGAFGEVFQVRYKKNGKIYAIKVYERAKESKNSPKDYYREKAILYDLVKRGCNNVVKLYADFEDETAKYLVMEFIDGKTLKSMSTKTYNYLPENQIINILTQLLKTLNYLHENCHILHRDIKPDNIILQKDNTIKILDFGISVYLKHSDIQLVSGKSTKGEMFFVPDEMLMYKKPIYDYKLDIFSLGFTIYSLMNPSNTGNYNLPQKTIQIPGGFLREDQKLNVKNSYSAWLNDLVKTLYDKNQMIRPTAKEALAKLEKFQNNPNQTENNIHIIPNKDINPIYKRNDSDKNSINPKENINNRIFNDIPISNPMSSSAAQINNIPKNDTPTEIFIKEMKRINSLPNEKEKVEKVYLDEDIRKNNKIVSSMKSLLQILYRLDIMNYIQAQLDSIISNLGIVMNQYFINAFNGMLINLKQLDSGNINQVLYDQNINEFINQVFSNNKSDISGTRPIVLFYMISSIFKHEFFTCFNYYQNYIFDNMIQYNFMNLNQILPMNNQQIYNSVSKVILTFKNNYKGPFVDNFYFFILRRSKCPQCNSLYGFHIDLTCFLQLDVKNPQNKISELLDNFFSSKIVEGDCKCRSGQKLRELYCLNLPNYLVMELEDKNLVNFNEIISLKLFDGSVWYYQYVSGIYKFKNKDTTNFVAVYKTNNAYFFYHDDNIEQCPQNFINLESPSMVIYKKISQ